MVVGGHFQRSKVFTIFGLISTGLVWMREHGLPKADGDAGRMKRLTFRAKLAKTYSRVTPVAHCA